MPSGLGTVKSVKFHVYEEWLLGKLLDAGKDLNPILDGGGAKKPPHVNSAI